MITKETLGQIPVYTGLIHPTILTTASGRWAVFPGQEWVLVSDDVTQEDLESRWVRWERKPVREIAKPGSTWKATGSKGKTYIVTFDSGSWSCTCPGYGFRRRCKHVDLIKTKHGRL